jgi:hypothetical protein
MTVHVLRNVTREKKNPRTVIPFATNAISKSCCCSDYFCSAWWWCGLHSKTRCLKVIKLCSRGVDRITAQFQIQFTTNASFQRNLILVDRQQHEGLSNYLLGQCYKVKFYCVVCSIVYYSDFRNFLTRAVLKDRTCCYAHCFHQCLICMRK